MQFRTAAAAAAVLLALAGCGLRREAGEGEEPEPDTVVVVDNRHWADVTIHLLRGTARVRLGTVTSMKTETFVVPAVVVGSAVEIRLLADPVGGDAYISEPVLVQPGDEVVFQVASRLQQSSLSVYAR